MNRSRREHSFHLPCCFCLMCDDKVHIVVISRVSWSAGTRPILVAILVMSPPAYNVLSGGILQFDSESRYTHESISYPRNRTSYSYTWESSRSGGIPNQGRIGSKRKSRETESLPRSSDEKLVSANSDAPSKNFTLLLGKVVQHTEGKLPSDCGDCGSNDSPKNVNGEDCNKPTSKDKSQSVIKGSMQIKLPVSSRSVLRNFVRKSNSIRSTQNVLGWLPRKKRILVTPNVGLDRLPDEIISKLILQRLEFEDILRFETLSTSCKKHVESDAFSYWRKKIPSREGSFTAINYYIKNKSWHCSGYDLHSKTWRQLPTFSYLPAPDVNLFKEYHVCGDGGLMCADVSKLPKKGELVVFNPLTRKSRALPPLLHPRNPVLLHLSVNPATNSYKVIVAGSSASIDEHLSKKVEVFDSVTWKWEEANDLPGPAFGLNDHQAGVCLDGILYFISFQEYCRVGVVAFDVQNGKCLENMTCPIPFCTWSNTLQLVESSGKIYLFSEQERRGCVEHCIDVLEPNAGAVGHHLSNVVRVKKYGGRGLQVYPEHTCVAFGDGKLCIFNTLSRDGLVYDIRDGKQLGVLQPPPPDQKGENYFSMNAASFTIQPCFATEV